MRLVKPTIPAVLLLAAAAAPGAFAAPELQTLNVDQVLKVDRIGDGSMALKIAFTAAQFQGWQAKYGQNPSLLKRDLGKYVSQYETSDWDVQQNAMERVVTISCKIKGGVLHKGGGVFEYRVPKQWRGGERAGSTYSYNFLQAGGGGSVIQNNVKLILPEGASQFTEDKAESGDRIIRYTLSGPDGGNLLLWAGLGLLGAGALLMGVALIGKARPTSAAVRERLPQ